MEWRLIVGLDGAGVANGGVGAGVDLGGGIFEVGGVDCLVAELLVVTRGWCGLWMSLVLFLQRCS